MMQIAELHHPKMQKAALGGVVRHLHYRLTYLHHATDYLHHLSGYLHHETGYLHHPVIPNT